MRTVTASQRRRSGPSMLLVDGRTASTPTAQYPPVEVQITVSAMGAPRVPFILYLPRLDTANPITLPLNAAGATTQEVRATTPLILRLVPMPIYSTRTRRSLRSDLRERVS